MKTLVSTFLLLLLPTPVVAQLPGDIIPNEWQHRFNNISNANHSRSNTPNVQPSVQIKDLSHNMTIHPIFMSCPKVNADGEVYNGYCYSHSEIRGLIRNRSPRTLYNLVVEVKYGESYFNKWRGSTQIRLLPSVFNPGVQAVVNQRIFDSFNSSDVKIIGVFEQQ